MPIKCNHFNSLSQLSVKNTDKQFHEKVPMLIVEYEHCHYGATRALSSVTYYLRHNDIKNIRATASP